MDMHYSKSTGGFYTPQIHDPMPDDAVAISDELYAALLTAQSNGQVITMGAAGLPIAVDRPPVLQTPEQSAAQLSRAVQARLDAAAQALGYDGILAAISYADEPAVPKYQAEGTALRAWRSAVWAAALPVLDAVLAGSTPPAAGDLIASLPAFTAPATA
jgi:hypothetical protein